VLAHLAFLHQRRGAFGPSEPFPCAQQSGG
jgi:hypothetical protein